MKIYGFLALAILIYLLSALSLVTLWGTNEWWVRLLDFPRTQILALLLIAGLLAIAFRPGARWLLLALLPWLPAVAYIGYELIPYSRLAPVQLEARAACPAESRVRVLVANVKRGNENIAPLRELIRSAEPDLFLAVETDAWWDRQLDTVAEGFDNHLKEVAKAQNHFGIHLLSKLERESGEILYLQDQAVPSVRATFRHGSAGTLEFIGLHPKPPHLFQDSALRDAQLVEGARLAAGSDRPTIVAGDLNATPWEYAYETMLETARLRDPRVGRGLFNTYEMPVLGPAWPLDHVLVQEPFKLVSFMRGPDIGSDHRPVLADLCAG